MKIYSKIVFIALILINTGLTQNQVDANLQFQSALKLFNQKKYFEALKTFKDLSISKNSKSSVSKLFEAKCYYELSDYGNSEKSAVKFLESFNPSNYRDEVRTVLIASLVNQKKYSKAFLEALNLIGETKSSNYKLESKITAERIALNYLTSSDIKSVSNNVIEALKPFTLLILSKSYLAEGNRGNADESLSKILSNYKSSEEYYEAFKLKNSGGITYSSNVTFVGVLLPLTDGNGNTIDAGNEILEGIKFAFSEFNKNKQDKFGLIIRDSEKRKNQISDVIDEFSENKNVKCILGPIFSEEVREALKFVEDDDLAIISPTATDEDLISMSEAFYQANPTFTVRGKVLAQYVFFKEGKRNFAIINSLDGYSPILASAFAEEFQALGGNILVKETYRSKSFAVSDQIEKLIPYADDLDGVYLPLADKNDAEIILAEMVSKNIFIPLYGNQDWLSAKGLETSTRLSNTLTITSDYFIDYSDNTFDVFNSDFRKVTGKEVNRNVLYGYDTAKYLTTVLRNISPSRLTIKLKMESGIKSSGYHNNISFDPSRQNSYLNIIKFQDGIFKLVDKYKSSN